LVSECDGKWLFIVNITVIIKWCHYVHIFVFLKGSSQNLQVRAKSFYIKFLLVLLVAWKLRRFLSSGTSPLMFGIMLCYLY